MRSCTQAKLTHQGGDLDSFRVQPADNDCAIEITRCDGRVWLVKMTAPNGTVSELVISDKTQVPASITSA